MIKIKRALISVSDKSGILEFSRELSKLGIEIISTGGTAKLFRENNIGVKEIAEYTGFPEMFDGRVKTLHPRVHGGLLALRDNEEHMNSAREHGIAMIDMVVINLYPFEEVIKKPGVKIAEVIENIDIGGPAMLRSAAKNHRFVAVVCNPSRYKEVIEALKKSNGSVPEDLALSLAIEAYGRTAAYDSVINKYLRGYFYPKEESAIFPGKLELIFRKIQDLRYGENPHQKAAFYREDGRQGGIVGIKQMQGKELSFNNILDLNSAVELIKEFPARPAAVIVKHNNPCGVAEADTLEKAYINAWQCDRLSAFGGIVALNRKVDLKTALAIAASGFLECIIAPGFEKGAAELFQSKKNLRLLRINGFEAEREMDFKRVSGGLLLQEKDFGALDLNSLKVVSKKRPSKKEMESLIFGWKVVKHVKSNAIVLAKGSRAIGIGAGQMSRVESVAIAVKKAGKEARNSCLASDAFFPKPDSILLAHRAGVKAIIHPGGSIADKEIISSCDKYKIAMVLTGVRHFKH